MTSPLNKILCHDRFVRPPLDLPPPSSSSSSGLDASPFHVANVAANGGGGVDAANAVTVASNNTCSTSGNSSTDGSPVHANDNGKQVGNLDMKEIEFFDLDH